MTYQNPILQIAGAKNLFLADRFELTVREYDDVEVKRYRQTRVRRIRSVLKVTYVNWSRDKFCLLIDTRSGTAQLQSPYLEGTPEAAATHLTRIVFREVSALLQRVQG